MQEVTETVLRAVQQAGVRAILLEGPANLPTLHLPHPLAGSKAANNVSLRPTLLCV